VYGALKTKDRNSSLEKQEEVLYTFLKALTFQPGNLFSWTVLSKAQEIYMVQQINLYIVWIDDINVYMYILTYDNKLPIRAHGIFENSCAVKQKSACWLV
jgi:hypothetical protein